MNGKASNLLKKPTRFYIIFMVNLGTFTKTQFEVPVL